MQYKRNYIILPLFTLLPIFLFWLWYVVSIVFDLKKLNAKYEQEYFFPWQLVFTYQLKFYILFAILSLICFFIYFAVRKRFINTLYVKLHAWLSFISLLIIPLADQIIQSLYPQKVTPYPYQFGKVIIFDLPLMLSLILIIIANIYFVFALIRSRLTKTGKINFTSKSDVLLDFEDI